MNLSNPEAQFSNPGVRQKAMHGRWRMPDRRHIGATTAYPQNKRWRRQCALAQFMSQEGESIAIVNASTGTPDLLAAPAMQIGRAHV